LPHSITITISCQMGRVGRGDFVPVGSSFAYASSVNQRLKDIPGTQGASWERWDGDVSTLHVVPG
jgi:hypothetical protein